MEVKENNSPVLFDDGQEEQRLGKKSTDEECESPAPVISNAGGSLWSNLLWDHPLIHRKVWLNLHPLPLLRRPKSPTHSTFRRRIVKTVNRQKFAFFSLAFLTVEDVKNSAVDDQNIVAEFLRFRNKITEVVEELKTRRVSWAIKNLVKACPVIRVD